MSKKYKTFLSVSKLRSYLLKELNHKKVKVISFDVFDTLIHRRAHTEAIVEATCFWLDEYLIKKGISQVVNAKQAREEAYKKLIYEKAAQGLDLDINLDQLVLPWIRESVGGPFEGDQSLSIELANKECEFEINSSFHCPKFLSLINELKEFPVRIIYISDMYLGSKYVQKILDANNFLNSFDAGYVSGDFSLLKRTGTLFPEVLKKENIDPQEIIHIGDNKVSDGEKAFERGIFSLIIQDQHMIRRNNKMKFDLLHSKKERKWLGVIAAQYCQSSLSDIDTLEVAYGQRLLGPIYVSFIHRILERCREENIDKVFFFSREGFILKNVFDNLNPRFFNNEISKPESKYLAISRLTTFLAAMNGYSLKEIVASFNNTPHYSLKNLFAPLKCSNELISKIAWKYGFNDINAALPPFYMEWAPFLKLLEDEELKRIIEEKKNGVRNNLISYLEELGFFESNKVAIVDVGWSGQIQDNLFSSIQHRADCPQIFGIYLGTTLAAHWRKTPKNWMEYTHADECHLGWTGMAAFEFKQGLEAVIRAPHGTVIGYGKNDNLKSIEPILKNDTEKSRIAELDGQPTYAMFQEGIIKFTKNYNNAINIFNITASDFIPYSRMILNRVVRFPYLREVIWLGSGKNVSDLGSAEIFNLTNNSTLSPFKPKEFLNTLKTSIWKYGIISLTRNNLLKIIFAAMWTSKNLKNKNESLDGGIHFHNYENINKDNLSSKNKNLNTPRKDPLYENTFINHSKFLQIGRSKGCLKNLFKNTAPLSFKETLISYFSYRLTLFLSKKGNKHQVYNDGLGIKSFIYRSIFQFNYLIKYYKIFGKIN